MAFAVAFPGGAYALNDSDVINAQQKDAETQTHLGADGKVEIPYTKLEAIDNSNPIGATIPVEGSVRTSEGTTGKIEVEIPTTKGSSYNFQINHEKRKKKRCVDDKSDHHIQHVSHH